MRPILVDVDAERTVVIYLDDTNQEPATVRVGRQAAPIIASFRFGEVIGGAAHRESFGSAKRVWRSEHSFGSLGLVSPEDRFRQFQLSAACAPLSREAVTELLSLTANLIEERRRIRRVLEQLPASFTEVRKLLNELNRTVR